MIGVLTDSAHDAALIEQAVGGTARVVHGSKQFPNGDGPFECLVLGCRSRRLKEMTGLLKELERTTPWVPIVLVTDRDPDVARGLRDVRVSEIVWFEDLATGLQPRVDKVLGAGRARESVDSGGRRPSPRASADPRGRGTETLGPAPPIETQRTETLYMIEPLRSDLGQDADPRISRVLAHARFVR